MGLIHLLENGVYHLKYIGIIVLIILSFTAGAFWNHYSFLNQGAFQLNSSLKLQSTENDDGLMPKGTVFYPYSYKGEIATFVVFVNTKNLNLLEPVKFENSSTVSPIDGYGE